MWAFALLLTDVFFLSFFGYSISDSPHYLPAIFSLCVMGILENNSTLTMATLDELAKLPADVACKNTLIVTLLDSLMTLL
jgi:hypothetical protein